MTTPSPSEAARYRRWSDFLAKIKGRVDELCRDADEGARTLVSQDPKDPLALQTALGALDQRVEGIRCKMERTWHEQELAREVQPGPDGTHRRAPESAYAEWHAAERYLLETWTTCKVRCMGQFLRAMWPHVGAALAKPIACSQCGAPLVPSARHTSETIACGHCRAVNQCIPETVVYSWFQNAPLALALEQVLPQHFQVRRAFEDVRYWMDAEYRRCGERPKEPAESKRQRAAVARAYYVALTAAKSTILPATAGEQAAEVEQHMAMFMRAPENQ
jgi:hypothetical protein